MKNMSSELPIGIFDSGIGGLTVVRALRELLPDESLIYLGDTARVPYGTKSEETVRRYALENALFLIEQGIKCLVVACNTASAFAVPYLMRSLKVPLFGVIEPGARCAAELSRTHKVAVLGTEGTIRSQSYERALHALDPKIEVLSQSCPILVPLAEAGWLDNNVAQETLAHYLAPIVTSQVDVVILGCTHYPLFAPEIARLLGTKRQVVDSGRALALELKQYLASHGLCAHKPSAQRYFVTDSPARFQAVGSRFLGEKLALPTQVNIP